jgi:hypothetical protein
MKAVTLKSEDAFRNVIAQNEKVMDLVVYGLSLYQVATLAGWARGCEILFEKGARLRNGLGSLSLLGCAALSLNMDVLRFWITIGPELDSDDLYYVGCLEEAIISTVRLWRGAKSDWLHLLEEIISELVQRRHCLQKIAGLTSVAVNSLQKATGLLNTRAREVYDSLVDRGVCIQPYLQPLGGGSLFGFDYGYMQIPVMDMLYTAGFRDTNKDAIFRHVTVERQYGYRTEWLIQLCEWFDRKGVDPKAQWPNSRMTILHCLAWQFGEALCYNDDLPREDNAEMFPTLLNACCDSCKCGCSTKGCLPITMLCKAIENYLGRKDDAPLLLVLGIIPAWSFESAHIRSPEYRWFVTAFIRVVTFWKLGIRHSCCDLSHIQHDFVAAGHPKPFDPLGLPIQYASEDIQYRIFGDGYYKDFNPHASPIRYSPKDIRKMRKEDAFLLDLLEELMNEFELEFHIFEGNLQLFFNDVWEKKMGLVLKKLKKEDDERYGTGRREMGIVMETVSGEETDHESEDDHKQSSGHEGGTSSEDEDGI